MAPFGAHISDISFIDGLKRRGGYHQPDVFADSFRPVDEQIHDDLLDLDRPEKFLRASLKHLVPLV
jgi:hypothetical protein